MSTLHNHWRWIPQRQRENHLENLTLSEIYKPASARRFLWKMPLRLYRIGPSAAAVTFVSSRDLDTEGALAVQCFMHLRARRARFTLLCSCTIAGSRGKARAQLYSSACNVHCCTVWRQPSRSRVRSRFTHDVRISPRVRLINGCIFLAQPWNIPCFLITDLFKHNSSKV